jgi:hypothetical protein
VKVVYQNSLGFRWQLNKSVDLIRAVLFDNCLANQMRGIFAVVWLHARTLQ